MTRIKKIDDSPEVRRITWIGVAVNLTLTGIKFFIGKLAHSQALVADSIHSASDLITDAAILIGSKFWNLPPDAEHPNGHRRFETLISIGIGLSVMAVGVFLAIDALDHLIKKEVSHPEEMAIFAALLSVIVKEILFRYTRKKAKAMRSQALEANAFHHRSDALSSLPVLFAVFLSVLFPEFGFIDSIGALVVSLFIFKSGLEITRPGIHQVADGAPDKKVLKKLGEVAQKTPGVLSIHNLRTRFIGSDLQVSVHVVVSPDMTLTEAHDLAEMVEKKLIECGENVVDALVHIDPFDVRKCKDNFHEMV